MAQISQLTVLKGDRTVREIPLCIVLASFAGFFLPGYGVPSAAGAESILTERAIRAGHEIAVESCTGCHIAAQHQEFRPIAGASVPSFEEIANRADTSSGSLRQSFERTHLGKDASQASSIASTIHISDLETSEVLAYLLTQKHAP